MLPAHACAHVGSLTSRFTTREKDASARAFWNLLRAEPTRGEDLELQVETFATKCISINFAHAVYLDFREEGPGVYAVP